MRIALLAATALLSAAPALAQFQDRNLRLSVPVPKEHPMSIALVKMATCTADKSGGKLKMQPFYDGVLGNDINATQSARSGTIDMLITSTAPLVGMVPSWGVFDLPFLFNNEGEADQVLDGKVGDWFAAKLPAVGLVGLAWWENGFRHTTNSKRPITKLEDFDGVKMRVMQNTVYIDTFKSLGSNAVPMAFSEVYSALETKTVDGQENPFANIENMKFYEVQKYLTLTRHAYSPLVVLLSKKTWDTLSADEKKAVQDAQTIDERKAAFAAATVKAFEKAGYKDIQPKVNVLTYGKAATADRPCARKRNK
jgi:tripartite ATP-independent transporter DctP family solute receptor